MRRDGHTPIVGATGLHRAVAGKRYRNPEVVAYRWRNRRHAEYTPAQRDVLAAVKRLGTPILMGLSMLEAVIIRADGTRLDLGVVSRRVVTDTGVGFIIDAFQNLVEVENMNWHAMGTGGAAEAAANTALTTEVESRVAGTQSEPASNQYRTVATITATAGRAITEHGVFSASTVGVMLDRSLFTVMNLAINDSIQFTYTFTLTSGG